MNTKRLYKSNDRKIAGVCGGIAEYFGFDPTLVRLIWALVVLAGGSGVLLYFLASIIMEDAPDYIPEDERERNYRSEYTDNYSSDHQAGSEDTQNENREIVGFKYEEK
ncbi:MAG: PspC domain-containing protein [Butyrivibrio sp.]|nr:PspC domain-containing protein [Butyrivibrio sp.]